MHRHIHGVLVLNCCVFVLAGVASAQMSRLPADKAANVNPDTHLVLTFASAPMLGNSGHINIYDASDGKLVDTIDLSIPPSPPGRGGAAARGAVARGAPATTQSAGARAGATVDRNTFSYDYSRTTIATNANTTPGTASSVLPATPANAQLTIIGGFTDAFHFHPVIIHDNTATIYPHNNLLTYGKTYYVTIDPGVLTAPDFNGISGNSGWTFTTKKASTPADASRLVVATDGSGDFNTVQGAIDTIPDHNPKRVTLFIKNGTYEEIVYFRNKTNITLLGEDRKKVVITYANYEGFNLQPAGFTSSERKGTFPYRRAAFMVDNSQGIEIVNLTIRNPSTGGQAEALLIMGGRNIVSNVDLWGNTDTIQFNDSVYITDTFIDGGGDFLWGRGPCFFSNCDLNEHGRNVMSWVRSYPETHGFVFYNCRFQAPNATAENGPLLGRNTAAWPSSEEILINCAIGPNFNPAGWSLSGDTTNMHYWEYNTTNLADGKPYDVSKRITAARQLSKETDAQTIANYSNPTWMLGGWTPTMAPLILTHPVSATAAAGQSATFEVKVAAIPAATFQWLKNGSPITGASASTLKLNDVKAGDVAEYTVTVKNGSGSTTSASAKLSLR